MTLQLAQNTSASGLLSLNASAAGASYSMAHLVSATPAWCMPSDRPPQPAKMSIVAMARPSSACSAAGAAAGAAPALPLPLSAAPALPLPLSAAAAPEPPAASVAGGAEVALVAGS